MNKRRVKVEETKNAGQELWMLMKMVALTLNQKRSSGRADMESRRLTPLGAILRSAITAGDYDPESLAAIERYLNFPVSINKTKPARPPFDIVVDPLRAASQALVAFIRRFEEDAWLKPFNPIVICPKCAVMFLRSRSRQEFCSTKCRFEYWRETNPLGRDYWKPDKRLARKRAPLKTVVKNVGELSSKPTKKHGKARKA